MTRVRYFNTGPWPFYIGFTTCPDAFAREMRRLKIKEPVRALNERAAATTHFLFNHDTSMAIVVMPRATRGKSKEQYAALLAHEAVHVAQEMRERLGDLGHEGEAYLVQQIVQEGLQLAWATNRVVRKEPKP